MVTPLLVLDGNLVMHYAADALVLIVVGAILERHVGPIRWAVLFAAGALVGELAGYAWDPTGAGASIGICGLIGGQVVVQLIDRRLHLVASLFGVGLTAALTSVAVVSDLTSDGLIAAAVVVAVCSVTVNAVILLRRRAANLLPALSSS